MMMHERMGLTCNLYILRASHHGAPHRDARLCTIWPSFGLHEAPGICDGSRATGMAAITMQPRNHVRPRALLRTCVCVFGVIQVPAAHQLLVRFQRSARSCIQRRARQLRLQRVAWVDDAGSTRMRLANGVSAVYSDTWRKHTNMVVTGCPRVQGCWVLECEVRKPPTCSARMCTPTRLATRAYR